MTIILHRILPLLRAEARTSQRMNPGYILKESVVCWPVASHNVERLLLQSYWTESRQLSSPLLEDTSPSAFVFFLHVPFFCLYLPKTTVLQLCTCHLGRQSEIGLGLHFYHTVDCSGRDQDSMNYDPFQFSVLMCHCLNTEAGQIVGRKEKVYPTARKRGLGKKGKLFTKRESSGSFC